MIPTSPPATFAPRPAAQATAASLSIRLPAGRLRAGEEIDAFLANTGGSELSPGDCLRLARVQAGGPETIRLTHGVDVACPTREPVGGTLAPGGHERVAVALYDDLAPGTYRLSLPYRVGGSSGRSVSTLPADAPAATVTFRVLAYFPGPAPHLSAARLERIALRAARHDGDAHPTLIQTAEGSRELANVVASGEVVDAWNWSYLIALKGRFTPHFSTPPGIPMGPGPVIRPEPVLTLVVNARTGEVTDGGVASRYPRLSRLGPVRTLTPPTAS